VNESEDDWCDDRRQEKETAPARWNSVRKILEENFEDPDLEAVQVFLSVIAAHKLPEYPPAWLFLIAPSGSMKTVLLETLKGIPSVHFIDEVTVNTFISGQRDEPGKSRTTPASFLHRIGPQGVLVIGDFSTILAMDGRKQPVVMAQLRRIYDGNFTREFGTGENIDENSWEGRLTIVAGVTPEIDRHHSTTQALGERFLRTRWPRAGGIKTGLRAIRQKENAAKELRSAIHKFLLPILSEERLQAPTFSETNEIAMAHLSEFAVLARAHVPRERATHAMDDAPQPEGNTRLAQQLAQIARGWALLEGSDLATGESMRLVRRAALDCIPPVRKAILTALIEEKNPYTVGLAKAVVYRGIEDLEAIGLITRVDKTAGLSALGLTLAKGASFTFPQSAENTDLEK
jgi:hypothetical protein